MSPRTRTARPHRARRGEGELLRDDLLDAVERLLVERGSMEAVSMRTIADAVGVTPPSIYLHFADKDALFFEVCNRRFAEFGATVLSALDGVEDVVGQLEVLGRAYVAYGLEHPEHYRILFGQKVTVPDHVEDRSELPGMQALHALISVVQRGVDEGVLVPVDPVQAAIGLWSTVHGFVQLTHLKHEFTPELDVRGALDQVLAQSVRGLLADPQGYDGGR